MTTTAGYRSTASRNTVGSGGLGSSGRPSMPRGPQARGLRGKVVLALVLVLAVLAGAGWLVGFSPVLAVERVEVRGAHRLAASSVRRAAAVPLGVPVPRQDLAAIAGRVTSLPQIESAEVSRRWPNTIRVAVVSGAPCSGCDNPKDSS